MRMNHRYQHFFVVFFLLLLLILGGCSTATTPEEVAWQFWDAVARQDENSARRYTTEASRVKIDLSQGRWQDAVVTFGEVRIKGDDAGIETRIVLSEQKEAPPIELQTVLRRENSQWKVDYEKTMQSLAARNPFTDLVKELKRFGEQMSGNVERTLSDLKKNLPQIEKELKGLGGSVGKALQETVSELQKGLGAFTKALEKAAEEAGKSGEREQEKAEESEGISL
jgi:hypothetical protein